MFPRLVKLHDGRDDKLNGAQLRELGLDPERLIRGGLLERCGRQDIVMLEDDGFDWEAGVKPSTVKDMVRTIGPFGEAGALVPAADMEMYAINRPYLHETILKAIRPLLFKNVMHVIDTDLTLAGTMLIDGVEAPVYLARRLDDVIVIGNLDMALRARCGTGVGVVLSASSAGAFCLGPNVIVPILSNLTLADPECIISRDGIELAHRSNKSLALGGSTPRVIRTGEQAGTLHVPGKPSLSLAGNEQIKIFERLVDSYNRGSPDTQVKTLMKDLGSDSPQQAFRPRMWVSIVNVYLGVGVKRGYWRLLS